MLFFIHDNKKYIMYINNKSCLYIKSGEHKKKLYSDIKEIKSCPTHCVAVGINGNVYIIGQKYGTKIDDITFLNSVICYSAIYSVNCKQACCGTHFTILLTTEGELYSLGSNHNGCIGYDCKSFEIGLSIIPGLDNVDIVRCGNDFVVCKTSHDEIYYWGTGRFSMYTDQIYDSIIYNPIMIKNPPKNIKDIQCNANHILMLTYEGHIYYMESYANNDNKELTPVLLKENYESSHIIGGVRCLWSIDIDGYLWSLDVGTLFTKYSDIENVVDVYDTKDTLFVKTLNSDIYIRGNCRGFISSGVGSCSYVEEFVKLSKNADDIWFDINKKSKQKSARK